MAMAEILDSVRRIIYKWVNTSSRVDTDVSRGDTVICVRNARRFSFGDEVMLRNNTVYETGLVISSVDSVANLITLSTPVLNDWDSSDNTILVKTIDGLFVQGIYIGEPDVISHYPAITVNGVSRGSEWLTLESTKEKYQIEVGVYVKASSHEKGYRFLLKMADEIQKGLKYNITPLVGAYDITSLTADVSAGDVSIRVADRDLFNNYRRVIIEDEFESHENWVTYWFNSEEDPSGQVLRVKDCIPFDFDQSDTSIIVPKRFVFNSWPDNIEYGSIHKGELVKAAKISWFAEEEEMQFLRRDEPRLR
jgi:hypothetical protein